MRKPLVWLLALLTGFGTMSGCEMRSNATEDYLEVIGEAERTMADAGFRLNLSYNGPLSMRAKFSAWADSLQQEVPGMVLTSDNIYINYMPEQMGQEKIQPGMMQSNISYNMIAADSAVYGRILRDLLRRNIPFNLNIAGTQLELSRRREVQQELMQEALAHATTKLSFLANGDDKYEIVGVEEMDNTVPYGPEYYDFNRRMVSRLKVKARRL